MSRKIIALSLALALIVAGAIAAQAAAPQHGAADPALEYIRSLQKNTDGGFPEFSSDSDVGGTLDAMFAFIANGTDVNSVKNGGHSPIDYLKAQAAAYAAVTPGHAAKLVAGLTAAGEDPYDFAGVNYVAVMQSNYNYNGVAFRYGSQTLDQALYILARKSLGLSISSGVIGLLKADEQPGGCWKFDSSSSGCDTNSTAFAVQALVAAGTDVNSVKNGGKSPIDYFAALQNADGGFTWGAPGDSDANSTAVVLQALVAAGEDIDAGGPWEKSAGHTPMQALLTFRSTTTVGAFTYTHGGADNAYATYQAVPALLLEPLLLPRNEDQSTATPRPTRTATPAATATTGATATPPAAATPVVAATPVAAATPLPAATPLSQVLPSARGPLTMPRSGEGATGQALPVSAIALLLAACGCLGGGLLVYRTRKA